MILGNDTFCVLANNIKHIRAHAIKLSGKHSIINTKWILSCFKDNEFLNWIPENVLFLTKEHQMLMDENFDEYGDSYSELATIESLHRAMSRVELDVCIFIINFMIRFGNIKPAFFCFVFYIQDDLINAKFDTFLEFQKELFDEEPCFKIFEKCQVYFDDLNLVSLTP